MARVEPVGAFGESRVVETMSTKKYDGGPAFPVMERFEEYDPKTEKLREFFAPVGGMKLRDYFAVHAPRKPHAWFSPVMSAERPTPIHPCTGGATCSCAYETCWTTNHEDMHAWDSERERQRLIQWPYAYADAMLAERDRQESGR